jgi:hypothetical protein
LNRGHTLREGDAGWKPDGIRSLSRVVRVSHPTIKHYADGSIQNLDTQVIEAISPYIYRVLRFDIDRAGGILKTHHDPVETYGSDWVALARLGGALGDQYEDEISVTSTSTDAALSRVNNLIKHVEEIRIELLQLKSDLLPPNH